MRLECGPEAEVIGKGAALFYPAEAVAQGKPREDLAEARRLGRLSAEDWRRRQDGSEFLAHVTITPLYDDSGRPRGYGKVVRDLTEERAAKRPQAPTASHGRYIFCTVPARPVWRSEPTAHI